MSRLRTLTAMSCLALGAAYTVALAVMIVAGSIWLVVDNVEFTPMP